jgi:hypothetical protein
MRLFLLETFEKPAAEAAALDQGRANSGAF